MIDYLTNYKIKIDDLKMRFNKDILNKFEIMERIVKNNLDYLKSLGVEKFTNFVLMRPDLCFSNTDYFKNKINKFDNNLLKYIIENDPENLINFDI